MSSYRTVEVAPFLYTCLVQAGPFQTWPNDALSTFI